jgi:vacuolar-type H+-ATPase subunit D/Vma8
MSAGKKLLKDQRGELRLSVFDLLKQNQAIRRNVTENYIEDVQNDVLQQYFMLTFTYNLRNFGTAAGRSRGN